jgi:small-conductance mechanosensitive channel
VEPHRRFPSAGSGGTPIPGAILGRHHGERPSLFANDSIQLAIGLLLGTLLLDLLIRRILRRTARREGVAAEPGRLHWRRWLLAVSAPVSLLVWYYGVYAAVWIVMDYLLPPRLAWVEGWLQNLAGAGAFFCLIWLLYRVSRAVSAQLHDLAAESSERLDDILYPLIGSALRLLVPIVALFFLVRLWPVDPATLGWLRKLIGVLFIGAFAWLLMEAVRLTERAVVGRKELRATTNYEGRALVTRVSVLRKVASVLISVFALAAVLMLFDEVRDLGRSILASAGIAGVVLGFAAQRSLGTLVAGLQIALTQPIRIGDLVQVNDQAGTVEEITLSYVIVRIWDQRRMIVPISHFIEEPVINYTRGSATQTGVVTLRVGFSMPVPGFREHIGALVRQSPLWDKATLAVQVTNADHQSMELRIIAGAGSPGAAFDLSCLVREAAVDFIHRRYPQCLPKAREEGKSMKAWAVSEEYEPRDYREARKRAAAEKDRATA